LPQTLSLRAFPVSGWDLIFNRSASQTRAWQAGAAVVFVVLAWVLSSRINHPWTYNDDYNGAFWAQAARNLSLNGYLTTAGVPAPLYFGAAPVPVDALYVHHPTLLAALMLIDRDLLGESEAAARVLPIVFSLITGGILWAFVRYSWGPRSAFLALAFYTAAPMELHYGQMVNFEAPELAFMLAALCCFHYWRLRGSGLAGAGVVVFCALAMWTDWEGYLVVPILCWQCFGSKVPRGRRMAFALASVAVLSGVVFLVQIRIAATGSWGELFHAFRERSGQGDLAGGKFTIWQWIETQFDYITTLFSPVTWLLAIGGAVVGVLQRRNLSAREFAPIEIAGTVFFIDAFYVCVLRNQSYIHDFASFYYLIPLSIMPAFFLDQILKIVKARFAGIATYAATAAVCAGVAGMIYFGIRGLDGIDTQFCILDDDDTEPANLMPDLGKQIDATVPAGAVVICNFDQYYSPLPYYARRVMVNYVRTYTDWKGAVSDAFPQAAAGIIWGGDPEAAGILGKLPAGELHPVTVDGIAFTEWLPGKK